MKKVGINLISFANDRKVGTLVFTQRLLKLWFDLYSDQYEVFVYIQKHLSPEVFNIPLKDNIKIIKVPKFRNSIHRILFEQTLFYRYLENTDIIFSPSLSMPLFGKGIKIITIHDMIPFIDKNKYGIIRNFYVKSFTKLYTRFCDKIITVSTNSKVDIVKFTKCKPDKITIVYNFIPEDEILPQEKFDEITYLNDIDLKSPYFLTVCTLQPGKNLERLIDAFDIFHKNNPQYKLYIVGGKGWNYQSILNKISHSSSCKDIVSLGYRDDEVLQVLYKNCSGVLYVSLYEGFGIPPLEGFMFNKICLASNNSSLPEVVGKAGILVDPLDKEKIALGMKSLINEEQAYKFIVDQIKKFNPNDQVAKFNKIISEL